jgi:hypothetical protein
VDIAAKIALIAHAVGRRAGSGAAGARAGLTADARDPYALRAALAPAHDQTGPGIATLSLGRVTLRAVAELLATGSLADRLPLRRLLSNSSVRPGRPIL